MLFLACILINSCSCDKEKVNPCGGKQPTTAEFTVENYDSFSGTTFKCDTCGYGSLRFTLKDANIDSVWWQVGTDTRLFRQKQLLLSFAKGETESVLKITAKVKRNSPDKECFASDNGINTFSKLVTFINYVDYPIWGDYQGYNIDNPNDTFTVQIVKYDFNNPYYCKTEDDSKGNFIRNLPKGTLDYCTLDRITFVKNRFALIKNNNFGAVIKDTQIRYINLEAQVDIYSKIVIKYSYETSTKVGSEDNKIFSKEFKGIKIK